MLAIRNLLSSLNSLAPSGLLAMRPPDTGAVAPLAAGMDGPVLPADEGPYAEGGVEPPLDELLDDPVVHLLMRADHLEPDQVRHALTSGRQTGTLDIVCPADLERLSKGFAGPVTSFPVHRPAAHCGLGLVADLLA